MSRPFEGRLSEDAPCDNRRRSSTRSSPMWLGFLKAAPPAMEAEYVLPLLTCLSLKTGPDPLAWPLPLLFPLA